MDESEEQPEPFPLCVILIPGNENYEANLKQMCSQIPVNKTDRILNTANRVWFSPDLLASVKKSGLLKCAFTQQIFGSMVRNPWVVTPADLLIPGNMKKWVEQIHHMRDRVQIAVKKPQFEFIAQRYTVDGVYKMPDWLRMILDPNIRTIAQNLSGFNSPNKAIYPSPGRSPADTSRVTTPIYFGVAKKRDSNRDNESGPTV